MKQVIKNTFRLIKNINILKILYVISGRAFSMIAIMVGVLVLILLLLVAIFLAKFKTQKKEDLNVRHIGGSIYNKVPGIDTGPEGDEMED